MTHLMAEGTKVTIGILVSEQHHAEKVATNYGLTNGLKDLNVKAEVWRLYCDVIKINKS